MSPQPPREKASRPQTWLLDAIKKRSCPPSAAFMAKLQDWVKDPDSEQDKLRTEALRKGRDPDALAKWIAERSELSQATHMVASRPKAGQGYVSSQADRQEDSRMSEGLSGDTEATKSAGNTTVTNTRASARVAPSTQYQSATPRSQPPTSSASTPPSKLGPRGGIRKPVRGRVNRAQLGIETALDRRDSDARSKSSPINPAQPYTIAESPATAAARLPVSEPLSTVPSAVAVQQYSFPARSVMPFWHTSISQRALDMLERKTPRPQALPAIQRLKDHITDCEKRGLARDYDLLRQDIYKAEVELDMNAVKARKTRILTTESGLPRIFRETANFPWDLKADSWNLYERWMEQDFDNNILRGIVTVKSFDRNGDRLDTTYRQLHPKDPKQYGDNGAVLGQWWPSQLCAVRDGVHGAPQGGIYGDKEQGAYSIVLSSGGYCDDRDDGNSIYYSGTVGSDFQMTKATQAMITSSSLRNSVRVLRSSQLPKSNRYRPSCGLRYDGLYKVVSHVEVDKETQMYVFHLERVPDQPSIRFEGAAKRPTFYEEKAFAECKGKGRV